MGIKAGDVVQLKSGSEFMTAKWVEGIEAYCEWMVKGEMKGHAFALAQLELVKD
ncbi:DUF2158 domain-containing protein [Sphingopyxis sp.]|uniref:DUF2158 domain-containing protein n=1 Tax=Sphingopyxis sp. TaxID=1908224 RepID=UPI003D6CD5E1